MRLDALKKLWDRLRAGDVDQSFDSDSFTDSELAAGRMILPLLDDLAAAQKAIEELTARTRAVEVVLRLLPAAAIVLDRQGRLLSANVATRALFGGSAVPERVVRSALQALCSGTEMEAPISASTDYSGVELRVVPAEVTEEEDDDPSAPGVVFLVPSGKPAAIDADAISRKFALTPAQMKVLGLVCRGLTNREIAEQLDISVETARKHVAMIFARTGVNKRSALVALAYGARFGISPHTPNG